MSELRDEEEVLICCCGKFPNLRFFDGSLWEEQFRSISTLSEESISIDQNARVVKVPLLDSLQRIVAVGSYIEGGKRESPVVLYDVDSKRRISQCLGHEAKVFGLSCVPSTLSSDPLIVSGGYGDGKVLVFDALEGKNVCKLPFPKGHISRILHVPGWIPNVFVGGWDVFSGYDLTTQSLVRELHVQGEVWGVCASPSRNVVISVDRSVRIWSLDDLTCQKELVLSTGVRSAYYIEETNELLLGLFNRQVGVWDLRKSDEAVRIIASPLSATAYDFARLDQHRFVCGFYEGSLALCTKWSPRDPLFVFYDKMPSSVLGVCVFGEESFSWNRETQDESERLQFLQEFFLTDILLILDSQVLVQGIRFFVNPS